MGRPMHSMTVLFDQLGLESTPQAIADFRQKHRPLPADVRLADASIWNESQADFLRSKIELDADWAIVVDQLNAMLR